MLQVSAYYNTDLEEDGVLELVCQIHEDALKDLNLFVIGTVQGFQVNPDPVTGDDGLILTNIGGPGGPANELQYWPATLSDCNGSPVMQQVRSKDTSGGN